MDSTAGDLNRGVQEVSLNIERQLSHTSSHHTLRSTKSHQTIQSTHSTVPPVPPLDRDVPTSHPAPLTNSSSSGISSEDDLKVEKLDSQVIKVNDVKEGEEAWAHLPPHERDIIKGQLVVPDVKVKLQDVV